MIRILLTVVLPLLLPTLVYLLWLAVAQRAPLGAPAQWRALPWPWLVGIGLALVAAMLYFIGTRIGGSPLGVYVPPQYIDGQVVPGHVVAPAAR
ncbi:MAG TPA: DUF6111 family protein [Stellaceae bacterium]|nr:DUF6111 family protein [Stellaceae bacterium]